MKFSEKDLDLYKTLTPAQVRLIEAMNAVRNKNKLVNTCIAIVGVLLIAALYFYYHGQFAEGSACLTTDGIFGVIGHKVYNHYFPAKPKTIETK